MSTTSALLGNNSLGSENTAKGLLIDLGKRLFIVQAVAYDRNGEFLEAVEEIKEVVNRLGGKGGLEEIREGDVEKLNMNADVLRGLLGELEDEDLEVIDEKSDLKTKRTSGEWVVVGDDDEEAFNEKKEIVKKGDGEVKALKRELESISTSINQLIPLLPHPKPTPPPFAQPLRITDFLGNTFPFPSEYSIAELEAIIKVRYVTGRGSRYIQSGQFELLDVANNHETVTANHVIKPGMKLLIALVVDGVAGDGYLCPSPSCKNGIGAVAKDGGRTCIQCGLWFLYAKAPGSAQPAVSSKQTGNTPQKLRYIPYKLADRFVKSSEDISLFKCIKIYPLADLGNITPGLYKFYRCKSCYTHLALSDDIISRNFRGQHGKGFLFNNLYNITRGPTQERTMTTGKHDICDVYCRKCGECVGWGYEKAEFQSEDYKIGKFLVEQERVETNWELDRNWMDNECGTAVRKDTANSALNAHRGMELLSRVTTVKGELLGLEYLEERLRALMDEEIGVNRDKKDEEGF